MTKLKIRYSTLSVFERCTKITIIHDHIVSHLAMFAALRRLAEVRNGAIEEYQLDSRIRIKAMGADIVYEKIGDRGCSCWGSLEVCVMSIADHGREVAIMEKVLRAHEATMLDLM